MNNAVGTSPLPHEETTCSEGQEGSKLTNGQLSLPIQISFTSHLVVKRGQDAYSFGYRKNKQKKPQTNLGQSVGESPVRGNPLTHWELASLACEHQRTGKHQNILLSKEKPGKGQGSSYHSIGPRLAWLSMLSRSTFLSLFVPGGALAETGGPNPNFRCEKSVKICGLSTCTLPTD